MSATEAIGTPTRTIRDIPVELIDESPQNPRKTFRDWTDLTKDIALRGVLSPVLVRPRGERFELIFGHRRFRAADDAGLEAIPAMVRDMDDRVPSGSCRVSDITTAARWRSS